MATTTKPIKIGRRATTASRGVPLQRRTSGRPLRASQVTSHCLRCARPVDRGGA